MGFFRERRRARQSEKEAAAASAAASVTEDERLMRQEEELLAEQARRMMLGGNGGGGTNNYGGSGGGYGANGEGDETTPGGTAAPSNTDGLTDLPLSPVAESQIARLHSHFDVDADSYLDHTELSALQLQTSGASMTIHEYTMICHALQCDPRRGITLDALRVTYATVEGSDANLELDYDNVFGIASRQRGNGGDGGSYGSRAERREGRMDGQASAENQAAQVGDGNGEEVPDQPHLPSLESCTIDAPRLEMGDHVYRRRAAGLAQVHAIVVSMAPGDDGPLLLADFTGQAIMEDEEVGGEEIDGDEGAAEGAGNADIVDEKSRVDGEANGATYGRSDSTATTDSVTAQDDAAAIAARGKEMAPDPTVERVRILCVEGKKNIRKWKKVRYGPSRIQRWFRRSKSRGPSSQEQKQQQPRAMLEDEKLQSISSPSRRASSSVSAAEDTSLRNSASNRNRSRTSSSDLAATVSPSSPRSSPKSTDKNDKDDIPETDPGTLVVERVNFLLENQNVIPPWHALKCNSECLAVWCKTGRFSTYQVSGYLHTAFMGQAKTALTVGAAASSASVTVPAAGYMGWLGFTTQVSLLALHPWLIPAIAGYGIASIGVPMYILKRCGKVWAATTIELNDAFWSRAPPDVYVDCIKRWSGLDIEE